MMENKWLKLLRENTGKKVRLRYFIPPGASIVSDEDSIHYMQGKIDKVDFDSGSGLLTFHWAQWFVDKAKFHTTHLGLNEVVIFALDVFPDDYDWVDYTKDKVDPPRPPTKFDLLLVGLALAGVYHVTRLLWEFIAPFIKTIVGGFL